MFDAFPNRGVRPFLRQIVGRPLRTELPETTVDRDTEPQREPQRVFSVAFGSFCALCVRLFCL